MAEAEAPESRPHKPAEANTANAARIVRDRPILIVNTTNVATPGRDWSSGSAPRPRYEDSQQKYSAAHGVSWLPFVMHLITGSQTRRGPIARNVGLLPCVSTPSVSNAFPCRAYSPVGLPTWPLVFGLELICGCS